MNRFGQARHKCHINVGQLGARVVDRLGKRIFRTKSHPQSLQISVALVPLHGNVRYAREIAPNRLCLVIAIAEETSQVTNLPSASTLGLGRSSIVQGFLQDLSDWHLLAALIGELQELKRHHVECADQSLALGAAPALLFDLFFLILVDTALGSHAQPYYTTRVDTLTISDSSRVLILTGAGVSAESGIATFRAAGGLWEDHPVEQVASMQGFLDDPALVWKFYSDRRKGVLKVKPNAGHFALAELEARLGDRMLLTTQNVDGLHQRAGSKQTVELHGNLLMTRCLRCDRPPFSDHKKYYEDLPECSICADHGRSNLLRPHIVWFGEALDYSVLDRIQHFIEDARENLIFLAVGTSGAVYPAAALVEAAKAVGGETWLINLDEAQNAALFDHVVLGKSGDLLPTMFAET